MNTFVITGGNSGIGLQSARELLDAGHRVIIWGRDNKKVRMQLNLLAQHAVEQLFYQLISQLTMELE